MCLPRRGLFFLLTLGLFFQALSAVSAEDEIPPDPFEPDSQAKPLAVQEGVWILRNFHNSIDEDWFSFTPNSKGILTAETSGDTDTVIVLYAGVSVLVKNDDRDENNPNARAEYYTEPGISYLIKVSAYDGDDGPYRFRVSVGTLQMERTEPNDTQDRASVIALDSSVSAGFHVPEDVDWYTFKVPQPGILIIRTEGSLDTVIELYNDRGTLMVESDRGGAEDNALITLKVPAGAYFIKIREYENRLGRYYLRIRYREPRKPDMYEDDDELERAPEILVGTPQGRNFTDASDADWAKLQITREGIYVIGAAGRAGSLDTYIEMFDYTGNGIAADDDSGGNLQALLTVNLVPGIYFIKVSASFDLYDGTEYTLSVTTEN